MYKKALGLEQAPKISVKQLSGAIQEVVSNMKESSVT